MDSPNKEILNILVDKIEVGERVNTAAKEYVQNVRIKYKFIGRLNWSMNKLLEVVSVKIYLGSYLTNSNTFVNNNVFGLFYLTVLIL